MSASQPMDAAMLTMSELGPLEALLCEGFPAMWVDLASSFYTGLVAIDPPLAAPEILAECAVTLTRKLANDFGGGALYIPKGGRFEARIRDDKIRMEFRGNNARQLGLKYKLSEMQIRNIVGGQLAANATKG